MSTENSEMVLRVAKALLADFSRQRGVQAEWDSLLDMQRDIYLLQAVAALRALEEPTQSMLDCRMPFETNDNALRVWKAQINTALHYGPWAG